MREPRRPNVSTGEHVTGRAVTGLAAGRALARIMISSALFQARTDTSPALIVQGVVQPAAFTVVALLARRSDPDLSAGRMVLGCGLISLWGVAIWQAGLVLRQELWQGTLASLVTRPAPLPVLLVGKSLGATARAAVLIAATVECVALAAGDGLPMRAPLLFLAAAAAAVLSASAMGLLLSSLFLRSRASIRMAEVLGYPVFILGGLLIPLSLLPRWVRPLSGGVSLRWAGELLGAASSGGPVPQAAWAWLAVTSAVYAVTGCRLLVLTLRRARREATLDLY